MPKLRSHESHCRLCAEPSARSRLVCVDDEVIDIKKKMLLVNVDVSAPSPLPRGVCYSCLCLLDKTAAFLDQVKVAQYKLALIYQDYKDNVEEYDNMDEDFDFSVKEEPQDDETADIKPEPCPDELPEEAGPASKEPQNTVALKKKRGRPRKESKIEVNKIKTENEPLHITKIETKKGLTNTEPNTIIKKKKRIKRHKEKKDVKRRYLCECGKAWEFAFQLKNHQRTHTERTRDYICHICGKSYMDSLGLLAHALSHKPKRYKCEDCGKRFMTPYKLKRHATQHSSERPFACNQCGKTFAQKRHLKFHSAVHSDLRPHMCSFCNKGFKTKTVFNVHVRMHTGVRPYSCEHCDNRYFDHSTLYKHVRSVHGADPRRGKQLDTTAVEVDAASLMADNSLHKTDT